MKPLGMLLLGILLLNGCVTFGNGPQRARVNVIGHRGASYDAPENTLTAFALAARLKADYTEMDCRLSRDGEVVVMHDNTADRTTTGKGPVIKMTLAELKQLDAGKWKGAQYAGERVPTLHEALALGEREKIGLYLDIDGSGRDRRLEQAILKLAGERQLTRDPAFAREVIRAIEQSGIPSLGLARKIIALVRETGMEKRVVAQSFSPIICTVIRIEAPELRVELLANRDTDKLGTWSDALRWIKLIDVDGCNLYMKGLTADLVDRFHKEGRRVTVWTVDEPDEMRRQAEMGVDGIITDRPDLCLKELKRLGRR